MGESLALEVEIPVMRTRSLADVDHQLSGRVEFGSQNSLASMSCHK